MRADHLPRRAATNPTPGFNRETAYSPMGGGGAPLGQPGDKHRAPERPTAVVSWLDNRFFGSALIDADV